MVNRTENDRAHNNMSPKRTVNNVVISDKAENVENTVQICDTLIVAPLKKVAIGIRTEGAETRGSYAIRISKESGSEVLSGVLQSDYEVIRKDEIAGGSTLCISVSTDSKIDKVYITVIGDYRGTGT